MKILFIDESINRMGGVEHVICALANRLIFTNEVTVLSEYRSTSEPFHHYNSKIKKIYLIDSRKRKTNNFKQKNLYYYFLRSCEKTYDLFVKKRKVLKYIKNIEQYDVVIFGRVFTALDFLKYLKIKPNCKIIVRDAIHLKHFSKKIQTEILKIFPKFVDNFIVSSDESINEYNNFFQNKGKMIIQKIYNPLSIKSKSGYSLKNKTIVSIGRFDKQKGFENLIKASDLVFKKYPDWNLKIYGSGNYQKNIECVIDKCKFKNNIELLPATKDVVSVFNNSSIFVLPSRYEGYANILVEALSCGIPSISYNWYMGVDEIIKDGKNGLVVPLKNRDEYYNGIDNDENVINLAKKIEYLIENKEVCDQFSNEASKIVISRNPDKIIEQWLKIIND